MEHRAKYRWDRTRGEAVPISEGPRAARQYSPDEADPVKGRYVVITVPHAMADRAEAAGVPVDSTCRGAALRGLRDATKLATGEIPPDRTGNTDRAALARGSLGQEIREARETRRLSRRDLMNLIHVDLSAHGFAVGRGWGPAQAQQWELGKSAPKMVEPIIRALGVEDEQADRWRRWWALARRGVSGEAAGVETEDIPTILEQRMAEAEVESLERIAKLEQELVEQGIELP